MPSMWWAPGMEPRCIHPGEVVHIHPAAPPSFSAPMCWCRGRGKAGAKATFGGDSSAAWPNANPGAKIHPETVHNPPRKPRPSRAPTRLHPPRRGEVGGGTVGRAFRLPFLGYFASSFLFLLRFLRVLMESSCGGRPIASAGTFQGHRRPSSGIRFPPVPFCTGGFDRFAPGLETRQRYWPVTRRPVNPAAAKNAKKNHLWRVQFAAFRPDGWCCGPASPW